MNLKELRRENNLSQEDVAKIIGSSQTKVGRIESGKLEMKLSEFGRLKNALKLNAEYYESLIDDAVKNAKPRRNKSI
ncbi:MAG: helix-turn-helix transcriptional regulator [Candidatus Izemoplasmatales bacterium]|nr:helix-turn-helix transcriptional regulator [Candidatus Izemoplasmatales bacterium]